MIPQFSEMQQLACSQLTFVLSVTAKVSSSSYLLISLHPIPWTYSIFQFQDIIEERFLLNLS